MIGYVLSLITGAMAFAFLASGICLCLIMSYGSLRKHRLSRKQLLRLGYCLFYVFALYHITVIRNGVEWERVGSASFSDIQWIPLVELISILPNRPLAFLYNVIGNLIWFVPLGALGGCLYKEYSIAKAMMLGCAVSVSIECLQFLFANGISDIDDVILNTLGALLGYGIFQWIRNRKKG